MLTEFIIIMFSFANSLSLWPKSQPFDGLTVAPHVGAWIEIVRSSTRSTSRSGRTPRGCVDWNTHDSTGRKAVLSRTPRGCVDWNYKLAEIYDRLWSRTPRGCVDWNRNALDQKRGKAVAPHVGAWIEINRRGLFNHLSIVAPHVGAWIEIKDWCTLMIFLRSHPTWVRGLK